MSMSTWDDCTGGENQALTAWHRAGRWGETRKIDCPQATTRAWRRQPRLVRKRSTIVAFDFATKYLLGLLHCKKKLADRTFRGNSVANARHSIRLTNNPWFFPAWSVYAPASDPCEFMPRTSVTFALGTSIVVTLPRTST